MWQRRLARDLDVTESEVRRMLKLDHATKAATINRALRRLGRRVSLTVGETASSAPGACAIQGDR